MKNQMRNIIVLVLVSMVVLFFVLKDDFNNILYYLARVNIGWLLLAILLYFIYLFFQTLCMANLARNVSPKLSLWDLFHSVIICTFFSAITPSAAGGQPFQVYFLKKKGMRVSTATNLVIEQFTLYQIALVTLGLSSIIFNFFYPLFPANNLLKQLVLLGFLIDSGVIVFLLFVSFGKKSKKHLVFNLIKFLHKIKIVKNPEEKIKDMDEKIDQFHESAIELNKDKQALAKGIIYNFLSLLSFYVIPIVLVYSMSIKNTLTPLNTIISSAYVMLIGSFVPTPGASGGLEYAFADFFGRFVPVAASLMALLLLWRFVTYYLGIIVGIIALFVDKKEVKE